jgi:Protein of unknown function, DUF547
MLRKNYWLGLKNSMLGSVPKESLKLAKGQLMKRHFLKTSLGIFAAFAAGGGLTLPAAVQAQTEPSYAAWDALLKKHVAWNAAGVASTVSYKGFAADRAAFSKVLEEFSALSKGQYDGLKKEEKLAFLINAYNAFTIELILTKYPDLKSIRDLGSLVQKPWSKKFFKLLGDERSLDNVEHDMIRAPGAFDEPRIHMAVVCASIGCPALRPEAFVGSKIEALLDDSVKRFLRDRTRNRVNASSGKLEVSKIFDWYKGDFEKGFKGFSNREAFFARYAESLSDDSAVRQNLKDGKLGIGFLDYDWSLNDKRS